MKNGYLFNYVILGLILFFVHPAHSDVNDFSCGGLNNAYGPFDYRTDKDKLGVVEAFHFTPEVAGLIKGKSGSLGGDLDYTLRAFPNHTRALMAMVQLGSREKSARVSGAHYSVECYFQRAVRFRGDDGMVKMIYANYLVRIGRGKEALKQLEDAESLNDDDTSLNYNMGLVHFELKNFDKALFYAHRAYTAGFPLPGLRDKLKRAGKWRDSVSPPKMESVQGRDHQTVPEAEQMLAPEKPTR